MGQAREWRNIWVQRKPIALDESSRQVDGRGSEGLLPEHGARRQLKTVPRPGDSKAGCRGN